MHRLQRSAPSTESRSQRPARLKVPTLMDRARWSVWLTRRAVSDHSRTGQTADFHPQLPKRPGRATSAGLGTDADQRNDREMGAQQSAHGAALYARFRDHLIRPSGGHRRVDSGGSRRCSNTWASLTGGPSPRRPDNRLNQQLPLRPPPPRVLSQIFLMDERSPRAQIILFCQ